MRRRAHDLEIDAGRRTHSSAAVGELAAASASAAGLTMAKKRFVHGRSHSGRALRGSQRYHGVAPKALSDLPSQFAALDFQGCRTREIAVPQNDSR